MSCSAPSAVAQEQDLGDGAQSPPLRAVPEAVQLGFGALGALPGSRLGSGDRAALVEQRGQLHDLRGHGLTAFHDAGGELSRVALALKASMVATAKASRAGQRTLVFDEVDAGIGGRAADTVGRRLKQIAANNQVLCVTHLAQIAGFADHHYVVEKKSVRGRTFAAVEELNREARVREIGRMLSGEKVTPEALKHAERLIEQGC